MEIRIKRVCIVVLLIFLSIFFGIYLILASFDQIILQNYVEEFKKSYALQPISIGKKICSWYHTLVHYIECTCFIILLIQKYILTPYNLPFYIV